MFEGFEIIDTYTRKQAIEDGALIDVTELAREAGFKWPVAITQGLNGLLGSIPESHKYQDYTGRLWDALFMAYVAIKQSASGNRLTYKIVCHHEVEDELGVKRVVDEIKLELKSHPGDDMEPVITIDRLW